MAINTLATATIFQNTLDQVAVQDATTGWMDENAGQVIYNGGSEVKIPKMSVQGLADYDRDEGYVQGGVTLTYQTKEMTQDRGRKFQLDAMDINDNNFVTTAATVMGEFQRERVVPEIDAYRISSLVTAAIGAKKAGMVEYGYVPGAANTSALRKLKTGISALRDIGYNGPLVVQATSAFILELELELASKITNVTFSKGGIETQVPSVDGVPIILTPSNRMYSAITLYNGKSEQEAGGYTKGAKALDVNFFVCPRTTPVAVTKQDKMKIFTPDQNQDADAWKMNYRRYHDMWILDNKLDSLYVSIKDAKPAE